MMFRMTRKDTGGKTYCGYANKQYILDVNEKVVVIACNKKGTTDA